VRMTETAAIARRRSSALSCSTPPRAPAIALLWDAMLRPAFRFVHSTTLAAAASRSCAPQPEGRLSPTIMRSRAGRCG
jgi:hypothetical protein